MRKHTTVDIFEIPGVIHELGPKELAKLKKSNATTNTKILNLRKILGETTKKER